MKQTIAVIFGGRSVEHEVSIISAAQCIQALDKEKYQVLPIYITKQGIWYTGQSLLNIENFKNIDKLLLQCEQILISQNADEYTVYKSNPGLFSRKQISKIDIAFPVIHGTYAEDGTLQGFLEQMNVPYVGCNVLASAISMDKVVSKTLLRAAQIPVLNDFYFYSNEWIDNKDHVVSCINSRFTYPLIVKPVNLGSSVGVSAVNNQEELEDAIDLIVSLTDRVLVEPKINNLQEVNCAVLGYHESCETSVCEELFNSGGYLSYQDKYCGNAKLSQQKQSGSGSSLSDQGMLSAKREVPAKISEELKVKIETFAKQAFVALNCAGVVRVDFLIDRNTNDLYICELNAIPGSLAFHLFAPLGKSFTDLTNRLIEIAFKIHREKNNLTHSYTSNILQGFVSGAKAGVK